jgi:mediator of replication checkpoint protein 1
MLAAFDDDSEVDSSTPTTRHIVSRHDLGSIENEKTPERLGIIRDDDDADDDADDDDIVPKGRMAARMRARQRTDEIGSSSSDEAERAYERITRLLNESQHGSSETETECEKDSSTPSEDELPTTGPKRRLRRARNLASDEDLQRQSRQRSVSPLFVPLSGTGHRGSEEPELDDNNGLEPRLKLDSRVLALVEQKRKKREDRERIEEEKKAARAERMKRFSSEIFSSEDSDDDDGSARKLTQQSRPTRKAGKKALEEMNRETQRMSRNMELTHQARTKKKITKESFFARFNSMQTQGMERSQSALATPSMNSSSPLPSDVEGQKEYISPLTSPLCDPAADTEKPLVDINQQADELMDLPSIEDILTREYYPPEPVIVEQTEIAGHEKLHTKKAKAFPKLERKPLTKQSVRVRISRQVVAQLQKDGSDSDLEVITSPAKCRRIAIFENLPAQMAQESSSILKLKTLAHLTSPTRRSRAMTSAELSTMLRIRARQQAAKEREERIRELRAKGMVIETAEERAAMEADVEDLMEKARKEAEEISRKEKASRKKENKHADMGDSEDEDYELSGSDDADDNDPGNRDEDGGNGGEDDETTSHQGTYRLVDGEAEESGDSEDDHIDLYGDLYDVTSDDDRETPVTAVRRKRPARVILDDEDEEQGSTQITPAKASPESLKRPQFLNALTSSNLTMGLSQAFAATLGNGRLDPEEDSLNIIRSLPDPGLPVVDLLQAGSQVMVKDSQEQPGEPVDLFEGYTQSDVRVSESPAPRTWSQVSQIPDPTQDAGFVLSPFDQSKRFLELPASTIDTLILPEGESPTKRKKSRMLRGRRVAELSDIEEERDGEGSFESKANVFDIMRKASRKSAVPFDKSNSKAKEIVDEAAEESEDEYAGLGGGSDDNASEEDEYDREMINDNSGEVVDEKELAALNAYVFVTSLQGPFLLTFIQ